ncbi:MAG: hypothetical protein HQ582_31095 [Planctomycetes bacterium]|nr:hypothetical protein [Planctomycetota bacterium]
MSDSTRDTSRTCKGRPWYRLHRSTGCVLVPAAAVLILLVVPGDWSDTEWLMGLGSNIEHGWPWVYLSRTAVQWDYDDLAPPESAIPWLNPSSWSFEADMRGFRPSILLADVLAALVLLSVVAVGVEWRRRRQHRFWQFSLGEMLVVTCLIAAGLGWCQYNKQVLEREKELAPPPPNVLGALVSGRTIDYVGPLWLRKLAGERNLQGLHRVTGVTWVGEPFGDEEFRRRVEKLDTLSSLESLSIYGPEITDEVLESLPRLPQLRALALSSVSITDAGLAHVERLGDLRDLYLTNTRITSAGLKHLRQLKRLDRLSLDNTRIDDAGLVHLSGLANLRYLDLSRTDLNGSGLRHLKNLKHLEYVRMMGTRVEKGYVEEFSEHLPNCYVATGWSIPVEWEE